MNKKSTSVEAERGQNEIKIGRQAKNAARVDEC